MNLTLSERKSSRSNIVSNCKINFNFNEILRFAEGEGFGGAFPKVGLSPCKSCSLGRLVLLV